MDVKLAYLHRVLKEEIYMEQLEGFIEKGEEDKVCRLVHSLYRLKQAGWVWNRTFAHTIKKKLGFNMIHSDVGVYILCCHHKRGDSETDIILIFICRWLITFGRRLVQDQRLKMSTRQIVSNEGPWTHLILFGDQNHQRSHLTNHLDRSTGIHWEHTEEVQAPWCKQHEDSTPSQCSLREVRRTSTHWNQDILPTNDWDTYLCRYWQETRHCIHSNKIIMMQQ